MTGDEQCSALMFAFGILARCAEDAVAVERVTCEYGHSHTAYPCDRHRFRAGQVGCSECLRSTGRDVPLILEWSAP